MSNLGPQEISLTKKNIDLNNFIVRVRRQNAQVENVSLMKELNRFTETHYPNYATKCLKYPPTGFKFDQSHLHLNEGFPESAGLRGDVPEDWTASTVGDLEKFRLFSSLERSFSSRPSLIFNGLCEEKLLNVAKQTLTFEHDRIKNENPKMVEVPLSKNEKEVFNLLGINLETLDNEVTELIEGIFNEKK